jgi:hypothetical protein
MFFGNSTQVFAGTGFLGGPMWITPEVPADGDQVNLSALFHNAEPNPLTGDVLFYDGNVLLGKKVINISTGGVSTATVTFRVSAGDHVFSATIGNLIEEYGNGKSEPFALSPQTVQLPSIFVPSKAGKSLNASIIPGTNKTFPTQISPNNPLAGVISQINEAKGTVLAKIPEGATAPVSDTVISVDTWRTKNSQLLDQAVKNSSDSVKKVNQVATDQQKKYGKVSFSTNLVDRPFAYVKLFFFTFLAYLISHIYIFYGIGLILVYLILRMIIRRFKSLKKGSKTRSSTSKKEKMHD